MKDPETLRALYNERFKNPVNKWGCEDIDSCLKVVNKVSKWLKLKQDFKYKVLDVGCATGYYTKAFSLLGMNAKGIDYSDTAIEKATKLHTGCSFIHMDGFNPSFSEKFDIIFCKGFSGANTHDIDYVANWSNKYIELLNPDSFFVFSYLSNFTGIEEEDEIVNWSMNEIKRYSQLVNAEYYGFYKYYALGIISRGYNIFLKILGKNKKLSYYLIFKKK